MKVILRPLTPIWTGNNDGYSSELRATGLLGSLRWWFEGLVRALGHYACDPTEGGCLYKKSGEPICAACRLFGTTGWARRFRFRASGLSPQSWYILASPAVARLHENWLTRLVKPKSQVLWGERLELEFLPYLRAESSEWAETELCLWKLVQAIAWLGALGAKSQNGFGGVDFQGTEMRSTQPSPGECARLLEKWSAAESLGQGRNHGDWFDLGRTRFLRFTIGDPGIYAGGAVQIPKDVQRAYDPLVLPVAYDVRYKSAGDRFSKSEEIGLRPALKQYLRQTRARDWDVENLVGSSARSKDRTASRVFVQHLFRKTPQEPYMLKVWVHVPRGFPADPQQLGDFVRVEIQRMFRGAQCQHYGWEEVMRWL